MPRIDDSPHPVDVHVGSRIRLRRIQLALSQSDLADTLAISFQALQKYESGGIRVSASRLYEIAQALDAPVQFFFEGYGEGNVYEHARPAAAAPDRREIERFIRAFYGIKDPAVREALLRLVTRLGAQPAPDDEEV